MRGYFLMLIGLMALSLAITGAANWFIDPYAIWGAPRLTHWNTDKPQMPSHVRVTKYAAWSAHQPPPEKIVLGTSRSLAIKTNHPALGDVPTTYHMGVAAQPIRESALLFKHALAGGHLKLALIELDFFAFNAYYPTPGDENPEMLKPSGRYSLLLSADVLKDSWATFRTNQTAQPPAMPEAPPGLVRVGAQVPVRDLFRKSERFYAESNYFPPPYRLNSCHNPLTGEKALENLREILRLAYASHVDVRLFISPTHARQLELMGNVGLWDKWEHWKQRLVTVNAEEAARARVKTAFPLWDFSGYNSITTEALPPGEELRPMRWYHESSHFNSDCADLVLDRIFDTRAASQRVPDDFGRLVDLGNIDAHLERIRQDRKRYVSSHPQDEQEIRTLVAQSAH